MNLQIKITPCKDAAILATLNKRVQNIHAQIEPQIFKQHNQEEIEKWFADELAKENKYGWIAHYEDRPIGYIFCFINDRPENPFCHKMKRLMIDHISVEEDFQGKGVAQALLREAKEFALKQKINRIEMDYYVKNQRSGKFFQKEGFKPLNERKYCLLSELKEL